MDGHGYTYTTISSRPGDPLSVSTSFYLDETVSIRLYGQDNGRPFLGIDHGDVGVNIGPRANVSITAEDVALVRKLAEASAALLAEVERLHRQHTTGKNAA